MIADIELDKELLRGSNFGNATVCFGLNRIRCTTKKLASSIIPLNKLNAKDTVSAKEGMSDGVSD